MWFDYNIFITTLATNVNGLREFTKFRFVWDEILLH